MEKNNAHMRYSAEQLAAIGTDARETLVSAGAGSGKTSTVTQRVVNLVSGADPEEFQIHGRSPVHLDEGTDIKNMLIVTFTKASASEMRTRIVRALEHAAREAQSGSDEQKWLAAQADAALSAEIDTIHGLCSQILHDHYEICGVTPDFGVLDEGAGRRLREECAREAVEEFIEADQQTGQELLIWHGPTVSRLSSLIDSLVMHADHQPEPDVWIRRHYGRDPEDDGDLTDAQAEAELLGELVLRTQDIYRTRKIALGLLDYSDLEHLAIRTVRELRRQGRNLANRFRYIFVDEYQDVNPVQETLLQELGADSTVFMVGDMKQSIYGFRFAAPQNFHEKDRVFKEAQSAGAHKQISIHMNRNYRSTPAVVAFTNAMMRQLMSDDFGGVAYDEEHKLICSRREADGAAPAKGHAEILIAHGQQKEEAQMICEKICELQSTGQPLEDIVVLTRSLSGTSGRTIHHLREHLRERGIETMIRPEPKNSVETELFLNILRILDDPKQDIPLLSVMRSPFFGFGERDFSRIAAWQESERSRAAAESGEGKRGHSPFNTALYQFEKAGSSGRLDGENEELYRRLADFESELQRLRSLLMTMSVHEAAEEIARRLDFRAYLLVQPDGAARAQAFSELLAQLQAEEQISGSSLHAVLDGFSYNASSKNPQMDAVPNVVRIMTIHASKGLEFPVVFLANVGKQLWQQHSDKDVQISSEYGITLPDHDSEKMTLRQSEAGDKVKEHRKMRDRSEELRVLYVALTRARDEIYVCGSTGKNDDPRKGNESVLHWVMQAWDAVSEGADPSDDVEAFENTILRNAFSDKLWEPDVEPVKDSYPCSLTSAESPEPKEWRRLVPRERVPSAVSVTEQHEARSTSADNDNSDDGETSTSGRTNVVKGGLFGADRGILLHQVLEWAVSRQISLDDTIRQMDESRLLTDAGRLTLDNDRDMLESFLTGELGQRAAAADARLTERHFILEVDPPDGPDKEGRKTLLKGTIDLAFLEDKAWTIVDYKSDADARPDELRKRHSAQLQTYRQALEKLTDYPVREMYVFSLASGEAVRI